MLLPKVLLGKSYGAAYPDRIEELRRSCDLKLLAEATLSTKQLAKMELLHFPDSTAYDICFGWKEENSRWKLLTHFMEIAAASI